MARVELNEEQLNDVVGGAFNYYTNSRGQSKCRVDDVGTYYVSSTGFENVVAYSSDITLTAQEIVDWALANGYFSTTPF